jgi:putative oxidoreductase
MIRRLYATDDSTATSILRLVLGIVFFAHGAQKMLGWFGGPGLSGTMEYFTGAMHIPVTLAFVEIAAEFFGAIALIPGIPDPNRSVRSTGPTGPGQKINRKRMETSRLEF